MRMFKKNLKKFVTSFVSACTILSIIFGASILHVELAYAAALTTLSDTQSSVKASALSDHTIQFVTQTGVAASGTIAITFPAGYVMGTSTLNNVDFATSTSGSCSGFVDGDLALSPANGTWGYSTSSQTITFTSGTGVIPANRCIQVRIGSNAVYGGQGVTQIANPSSPGAYSITIGGTFGDTGTISTYIVPDDTIAVTGTVQQSLTFTISTTTIYFGTLGAGAAKYASSTNPSGDSAETIAHTLAVGTNAPSGFALSVRGQTLTSQQNSNNTISAIGSSAASSTAGTEQFGLRATESGGVGTAVAAPYSFPTSYGYGATATTSSTLATGSGSTPTSTYSLRYVANVGAITEAGIYAANLLYVATANF
jgi:hypothetical protein